MIGNISVFGFVAGCVVVCGCSNDNYDDVAFLTDRFNGKAVEFRLFSPGNRVFQALGQPDPDSREWVGLRAGPAKQSSILAYHYGLTHAYLSCCYEDPNPVVVATELRLTGPSN